MNRKRRMRLGVIACLSLLYLGQSALAADARQLTLSEAVQLALRQNRALKIARLKIVENEQKKAGAKSSYFPELKNESSFLHTTALENIEIPAGAFGLIPNVGFVPNRDILIDQGNQTFVTSGTSLVQPLTPLIRVKQANRIAASEIVASRDELKQAENEVAVRVHEIYYSILVTRLQKQAAEEESEYAATHLQESEEDVRNGSALRIATIEGRAGLLESQQSVLTATLRLSDLTSELNEALGLPLDTRLELAAVEPSSPALPLREDYLRSAWAGNPQILSAMEVVKQAQAAVTSAKSTYIPDVSVFARQSYQNGVPFLVHNFGTFGINLSYDVFDFGKRRAEVREREAKLAQAQENLERLKEGVSVQIERSYNKVEQAKNMLQVANEVVKLRTEGVRLAENQLAQGAVLISARRQASAASYKARADLLQAQLAHLLARAELEQTAGRTPGL
jgi:outer membrane protein TolC